ncbi:hypothetical protein GALL_71790 [mine drainage metagenome]|uniref:Uncharacterized protein n=1 Tax=mine drainage metagenome TaxID=410659 RepID=A0A1J5T434_9ZZZZ
MSLDAQETRLTAKGEIIISENGILIKGFDAQHATCRDVAVLALCWGIGELQRDLIASIEKPGGGNACID